MQRIHWFCCGRRTRLCPGIAALCLPIAGCRPGPVVAWMLRNSPAYPEVADELEGRGARSMTTMRLCWTACRVRSM